MVMAMARARSCPPWASGRCQRRASASHIVSWWPTTVSLCYLLLLAAAPHHGAGVAAGRGSGQQHSAGLVRRLLLLSGPVGGQRFAKPDYTLYHREVQLMDAVTTLVADNPDFMALDVHHEEDAGYTVDMPAVTVTHGGDPRGDHSARVRMLLDFGEHGRELISSELGLLFLRALAHPHAIAESVGGGVRGARLLALLQHITLVLLPLENAGGRHLVEAGNLCERKNGRGVDTNRNWPVDWGVKERDYDPSEEYPGREPFSEPEVKAILGIANTLRPQVWVNVHSGMEAMFVPWDHRADVAPGAEPALAILHAIHASLFNASCVLGSGGKSVGYLAHGTATDYMYSTLKVPISYTWEIFGDFDADYHDCFRMFNPLDRDTMVEVLDKWLRALFMLIELLPTHPALGFLEDLAQRTLEEQRAAAGEAAVAGDGAGADGTMGEVGVAEQQQQQIQRLGQLEQQHEQQQEQELQQEQVLFREEEEALMAGERGADQDTTGGPGDPSHSAHRRTAHDFFPFRAHAHHTGSAWHAGTGTPGMTAHRKHQEQHHTRLKAWLRAVRRLFS